MAVPKSAPPCVQLVAAFSRYPEALDACRGQVESKWGPIALASELFDHSETSYYEKEMGAGLKKQFWITQGIYDPATLSKTKLQSNEWETDLAISLNHPEKRPVNIDPGYITLTKLVLASAKDRAHRIYLADGIFAEECLYYLDHRWQARPWTYPDYQRADFQAFFVQAREFLKQLIKTETNPSGETN